MMMNMTILSCCCLRKQPGLVMVMVMRMDVLKIELQSMHLRGNRRRRNQKNQASPDETRPRVRNLVLMSKDFQVRAGFGRVELCYVWLCCVEVQVNLLPGPGSHCTAAED